MNSTRERAVILAAGNGSRLGPTDAPKALLDIGGRSILERQTRALRAAGVREILVVVGYRAELVEAACRPLTDLLDVHFTLVENPFWERTNTGYSMSLARPFLDGHAVYTLNGDVLFPRRVLVELRRAAGPVTLAIDVKTCGQEEVKVRLDRGGRLLEIDKRLDPRVADGEFIGIARFGAEAAAAFMLALDDELVAAGPRTYYDYALARMPVALRPSGVRFDGVPMIEIDFPEDLTRARELIEPRIRGLDRVDELKALAS